MFEPRAGQRPKSRLVFSQITNDLGLGTGMRQHVEEVEHNHGEIGLVYLLDVVQQPFPGIRTNDLVKEEFAVPSLRLHLPLEEIFLVAVLADHFVIVKPQIGHDFINS